MRTAPHSPVRTLDSPHSSWPCASRARQHRRGSTKYPCRQSKEFVSFPRETNGFTSLCVADTSVKTSHYPYAAEAAEVRVRYRSAGVSQIRLESRRVGLTSAESAEPIRLEVRPVLLLFSRPHDRCATQCAASGSAHPAPCTSCRSLCANQADVPQWS